ncbi:putative leader peptide [Glycomyces albidus]|uniref:putative leader peptide n=1 Tax=Glycomyces albidus TaxID=2656774 RepID=UPI003899001D
MTRGPHRIRVHAAGRRMSSAEMCGMLAGMSRAHGLRLVARRHVDLCRVFSAACLLMRA